ncbi:MAG TPA: TlpA disulfide reductase family protein [Vicinamibacteria bacterium]|nr:TlpA disulfide reductase family protein [Vicinamibacteria bacterium]
MPSTIERLHREFRGRGLEVLAINIQEDRATVARWVREHPVSTRILLDADGAVTEAYGVTATPTAFLVAPDGGLVAKALGTREWTGPAGRALLDALLGPPAGPRP